MEKVTMKFLCDYIVSEIFIVDMMLGSIMELLKI